VKKEKCTLYDLEYGEKTENQLKWETHTAGCEIWWVTLKKVKMTSAHLGPGYDKKTEKGGKWDTNT